MNVDINRTPRITVAAVSELNGRFLLVEEWDGDRAVYNQPAGHLEFGENLLDAVARETREETGWHFQPISFLGVYQWTSPTDVTYLRFCFSGACSDHDPNRALDTGIIRACWLTLDEIAALTPHHRSPLVMRCIEDYLSGIRYPLDLYSCFDNVATPLVFQRNE